MAPTPIVICSATPQKRDAILGLKLGADDFIPKPFDIYELEARLAAVLRRSRATRPREAPPAQSDQIHVGNLRVDRARKRVLIGTDPLALTATENRLITTLAERADEAVTRNDLASKVWGYEDASSGRTIDVHIRRLRAKLSATKARAPVIVAMRGVGYKLTSDPAD